MSEFFTEEDENKMTSTNGGFNLTMNTGCGSDTPAQPVGGMTSFNQFVISTCVPSHIRAARRGVDDWMQVSPTRFVSPSSGYVHDCDPVTCTAWVLRFVDGVKICAISGLLLMHNEKSPSPRKRQMEFDSEGKRHQDKAIVGSSAYLAEKFNLDDSMQVEGVSPNTTALAFGPRMNQYPWSGH